MERVWKLEIGGSVKGLINRGINTQIKEIILIGKVQERNALIKSSIYYYVSKVKHVQANDEVNTHSVIN